MPPTRRELLRLAAGTGFEAPTLEKVLRLAEALEEIARHRRLSKALTLKGGTALNLFFGPPKRLSVDLDFNYVAELERDRTAKERPAIEDDVERIGRALGYAVQRSADAHAGRKFYLTFRRTLDEIRDRIEIDINFLHRQRLRPSVLRQMWRPGDTPACEFSVTSFDELAAGKLIALLDRAAPRDAWDVAQLSRISGGEWPTERSRAIFVAMAGVLPKPLYSYAARGLSRIPDADVIRMLHPMLLADDRPAAGELREAAWVATQPLLELTSAEREYCERLQHGELAPELLFPADRELAERVAVSPPLLWKAENARRFTGSTER
jgi:predicted nucleotidyltransferase component of viral defense system